MLDNEHAGRRTLHTILEERQLQLPAGLGTAAWADSTVTCLSQLRVPGPQVPRWSHVSDSGVSLARVPAQCYDRKA